MPQTDRVFLWHDEVRRRLTVWAEWSRGHQLIRGSRHVLAAMMQKAAGEVPGGESSPYDFTLEINAADRAIAQMRCLARQCGGRAGRRIRASKHILMSVYLGQRTIDELAEKLNQSREYVQARLNEAETFVGAEIPKSEKYLRDRAKNNNVETV